MLGAGLGGIKALFPKTAPGGTAGSGDASEPQCCQNALPADWPRSWMWTAQQHDQHRRALIGFELVIATCEGRWRVQFHFSKVVKFHWILIFFFFPL